jgi:UDP-N-acetylglucosamine:LPS N-acetylglucosamine transferase
MRVLLVSSSGGHLLLLHALRPWWSGHERSWVTFRKTDAESLLAGERVAWAHHPTQRNVPNLLRNLRLAWRLLREERPDLVVSTGAGVAVPFFLAARLLGIATVFVEAYERIETASLSGRLCYPMSDLFVLQWPEQRRLYPTGQVVGSLL